MRSAFAALLLVVAATQAAGAGDIPRVSVVPVARTHLTVAGQPIVVPANPDVVVAIATFAPGARLPVHEHHYPHLVYVLGGVLTVTNAQTGNSFEVKEGDFTAEMQDIWHYGVNKAKVPVRLLVIDEVPRGAASNMVTRK